MIGRRDVLACGCAALGLVSAGCSGHVAGPATPTAAAGPLGLPEVHHLGLIVADRDRAVRDFADRLGYRSAYTVEGPSTAILGDGAVTTFQLRLAFLWLGNTMLEILQPTDDLSPHAAFLKQHGQGLHHIGYMVPSIDQALHRIGRGRRPPLLADGALTPDGLRWVYIDAETADGAVIELVERNAAAEAFFTVIYSAIGRQPG